MQKFCNHAEVELREDGFGRVREKLLSLYFKTLRFIRTEESFGADYALILQLKAGKNLLKLLQKHRGKHGEFDCIVPGSGGKDSCYASHILKFKYGMNPLTVTWPPNLYTDYGYKNFKNWLSFGGHENISAKRDEYTMKYLTKKSIDHVICHHGFEGLEKSLIGSEIIILLLPSTADTENIINTKTISYLAKNAIIINPGRGTLIDEIALLKSLNDGKLAHATLDVFRQEPLPADHLFWQHPKITVTPHIASETRPKTASQVIATNIDRFEKGKPLLYQVNFETGY